MQVGTSFRTDLALAMMEHQAGATPAWDFTAMSDTFIVQGIKSGVLEKVDWEPLITADTNPAVVMEHPLERGAIVSYTGFQGLLYNPEKVGADEVPMSFFDLADPKWKGKLGLKTSSSDLARRAFVMGNKEWVFAEIKAVLKNKPLLGDTYADMFNRYKLGEVWLEYAMTSSYLQEARNIGLPAAWQCLDYADLVHYSNVVRTGAPHPNAAKLVLVYLATPAGAKFMLEEGAAGNLYYPGNLEHDLKVEAEAQGLPIYARDSYSGLLEWYDAEENKPWEKEMDLILKMGG